ncbi:Rap1a/Tai family immunity protein, partial [Microbulbifer mangrovi]|uniref:Rap1a/Tai family immunity protein n=1 Tax=Microbulbifer mangrovi TaxID=927787 RepID=UPI00195C7276
PLPAALCDLRKESEMKILVIICALAFSVSAQAKDGNDLLENCQKVLDGKNGVELDEAGKIRAASCISYLSGFGGADSLSPLKHKGRRMFCIPKDVSLTDAADLTVKWMLSNKDKLHFPSHQVLAMANIVNFPCRA